MPRRKLGFISDAMSQAGAPCLRTVSSDALGPVGFYVEENHLSAAETPPVVGPRPSAGMVVSKGTLDWNWRTAGREYQTLFHPEKILTSPGGQFPRQGWIETVTILTVYFEPDFLLRCSGDGDSLRAPELRLSPAGVDPVIAHLFWALESELRAGWPQGRLVAEGIATVLAAALTQRFSASRPPVCLSRGGLSKPILGRVIDFIHANPGVDLSLASLCDLARLGHFHFCRQFKRSTGTTVHDYVLQVRINTAKHLLASTNLSIPEIGFRSGITNLSHFTTVFHKHVGVTPLLFRSPASF